MVFFWVTNSHADQSGQDKKSNAWFQLWQKETCQTNCPSSTSIQINQAWTRLPRVNL